MTIEKQMLVEYFGSYSVAEALCCPSRSAIIEYSGVPLERFKKF